MGSWYRFHAKSSSLANPQGTHRFQGKPVGGATGTGKSTHMAGQSEVRSPMDEVDLKDALSLPSLSWKPALMSGMNEASSWSRSTGSRGGSRLAIM